MPFIQKYIMTQEEYTDYQDWLFEFEEYTEYYDPSNTPIENPKDIDNDVPSLPVAPKTVPFIRSGTRSIKRGRESKVNITWLYFDESTEFESEDVKIISTKINSAKSASLVCYTEKRGYHKIRVKWSTYDNYLSVRAI